MTIFTFILLALAALLMITGAVMLKKNVRPILGFILIIVALSLFIGVTMDPKGMQSQVKGIVRLVSR